MTDFQHQKQVVLQFYEALDSAAPEALAAVLAAHTAESNTQEYARGCSPKQFRLKHGAHPVSVLVADALTIKIRRDTLLS